MLYALPPPPTRVDASIWPPLCDPEFRGRLPLAHTIPYPNYLIPIYPTLPWRSPPKESLTIKKVLFSKVRYLFTDFSGQCFYFTDWCQEGYKPK